jgi:FkbM family methyltransferase
MIGEGLQTISIKRSGTMVDYEQQLQRFYEQILRLGDCAIDIGAHSGRHTLAMCKAVGSAGRVVAYEPNPGPRDWLRMILERDGIEGVTVHDCALSNAQGRAKFTVAVDRPEESGLRKRAHYNGPTGFAEIEVDVETLDSFKLPGVRFIKIDVEGAELDVVKGAARTIAQSRPVVAFEFGPPGYAAYGVNPEEMYGFFEGLGYVLFSIMGARLNRARFLADLGVGVYWDFMAVPLELAEDAVSAFTRIRPVASQQVPA